MDSMQFDIAIIEDHPLVARITREVVLACAPEIRIKEFRTLGEFTKFDGGFKAILTDLRLPDAKAEDVLDFLSRSHANLPVLVNTGNEDPSIEQVVKSKGYFWVTKRERPHTLFVRVMRLLEAAGLMGDNHNTLDLIETRNQYQSRVIARGAEKPLTLKQVEIMECCSDGLSAKETARELGISLETVRAHMTDIFQRLGAKNAAEAVKIYCAAKRDAELRELRGSGHCSN